MEPDVENSARDLSLNMVESEAPIRSRREQSRSPGCHLLPQTGKINIE
jgi:hypothetical protein